MVVNPHDLRDAATKMVPLEECNREWKPTDPRFSEDLALALEWDTPRCSAVIL